MAWLLRIAAPALLVAFLWLGVRFLEPRLTFHPVRELPATPTAVGLPWDDLGATTSDGLSVHGWFVPAPSVPVTGTVPAAEAKPWTLLLFHGNAENIASSLPLAARAHAAGYAVALAEYRGYAGNRGAPSEAGIFLDGEAAWRAVTARPDVDPARVAVWGRSLGAAVATRLAAGGRGGALILESPFTSARDLLRESGAWLLYALSVFASYRFDQAALIGRVGAPILIIHGTSDEVVPFRLGERLFELASPPKSFLRIEGGGHNDLWARDQERIWSRVVEFLGVVRPPSGGGGVRPARRAS